MNGAQKNVCNNKMERNVKLANKLHKTIIDIILASPLNIPMLPDDIEREMYERIFLVIDEHVNPTCWNGMYKKIQELWEDMCRRIKEFFS